MSATAMLPVNERLLKARFPNVYRRILQSGTNPPLGFAYRKNEATECLYSIRNGKEFATYGLGERKKILESWFDGLDLAEESLYAVSGFGDGSHLLYFLENSSSGTYFLAAEKDPSLLRETFSRVDCSKLLSSDRFMLGVGDLDDDFFHDIQVAALHEIQEVNMVVFSPLHSADEAYYDQMRNELVRQYLVVRPLMEVNLRTATTIQSNTFTNLKHMATSPDLAEIGAGMEDIPFILVGAGPSLDESIEFLKEVQNRAIIVCSNSPLRKLINNGIKPHLVVTADPQSPTLAGFKGVKLDGLTLACPFSAYPEIVSLFPGRILSWCTFNPIVDLLKKSMGKPPGSSIMEKGTVSGCVLDISRLLGSKKVLLVGQDMCIRDDGRYYTDDSAYSDSGSHFANSKQGHRLPGNTQEKVVVESRLFVYLKIFEQFIAEQSGVEYRNLARTGVQVEGAPYMEKEEALDWVGNRSSLPFMEKIEQLLELQGEIPDLSGLFEPCLTHIEKIFRKSTLIAQSAELLPEKFSGSHYTENKTLLSLLRDAKEVNNLIEEDSGFWSLLFEGKTKREVVQFRRNVRDITSGNMNWEAVQRNKEYFWAISEGCHWLLTETTNLFPVRSTG